MHLPQNRGHNNNNKGETRHPAKLAITGCGRLLSNKSSESPLISLYFGPTAAARMSGKMSGEYFWVGLWGPVGKVVTPAENATSRDNATMYTSVDTTRNVFFHALQWPRGGEKLKMLRGEWSAFDIRSIKSCDRFLENCDTNSIFS